FVAGESSGDVHAAGVAADLRARAPELQLIGVGGERMRAAGVELLEHTDALAVMGFAEVVRHLPKHFALLSALKRRVRGGKVALLIVVDYPDFNMKLAAAAHAAGVPVLYFITPQVWAWRPKRLASLAKTVTRAAVILGFEEKLLRDHGIDATFVGHPLLDRAHDLPSRDDARRSLGITNDAPVLALFPGSREQEILRHLDDFVATARDVARLVPGVQPVVSVAPGITIPAERCPFPQYSGAAFTVLRAADAALCKSGTTTLEAAMCGTPFVITYRTSKLTYAIGKRLVKVPYIGLVNWVAGRKLVPEFVQDAFQPAAVAAALAPLFDPRSSERASMLAGLADVRAKLGTPGASRRVAEMALAMVK
ncbi:MAG: lipid-A-disaccharide synthase, partial [Gemmatimonadota bacterium]|nr:lipid-A-disaccharide synthase [Gemmatimonadota bacterium]